MVPLCQKNEIMGVLSYVLLQKKIGRQINASERLLILGILNAHEIQIPLSICVFTDRDGS